MPERRPLRGKPLMIATAGVILAVGCTGSANNGAPDPIPVGNLMPPPMVQVCVKTVPEGATVTLNGAVADGGCAEVYMGPTAVTVSADGYTTYTGTVDPTGEPPTITLEPAPAPEPTPEPAPE